MALTIRERILILFSTAPDGFSATSLELARKFRANPTGTRTAVYRLVARGVLAHTGSLFYAGDAIKKELGYEDQ